MVERVRTEGQGDVALQPPLAEQERRRRERAALAPAATSPLSGVPG